MDCLREAMKRHCRTLKLRGAQGNAAETRIRIRYIELQRILRCHSTFHLAALSTTSQAHCYDCIHYVLDSWTPRGERRFPYIACCLFYLLTFDVLLRLIRNVNK